MDLLQFHYFRVVARREHMSKAAEDLCIAQPSLSKTIRRLEKELGVPLFDRQGRSLRLNRFGTVFLEHVEQLFRTLEEGQRKVRGMAGLEQGDIWLVAASLIWLPELLQQFLVAHPSVHFHLSQRSLADMLHQLETGACDFCFSSVPLIRPGIQWRPLLTDEILLVVPAGHRLAGRDTVPLREVAQEAVVMEQVGNGLRDLLDDFYRQASFTPQVVYEVDEPAALLQFVKAGLGVAFVPALVKKLISEQIFTTLHLVHPTCQRTLGIAWHEEHYLSPAARAFRQFVMEYFVEPEQEAPSG
jgi:DNA-binding transcriptional LysR family regulator